MWRTILLGKLSLSIFASLVVGVICVSLPWREERDLLEDFRWIGLGVFFFVLAVMQVVAILMLFKKAKPKT